MTKNQNIDAIASSDEKKTAQEEALDTIVESIKKDGKIGTFGMDKHDTEGKIVRSRTMQRK